MKQYIQMKKQNIILKDKKEQIYSSQKIQEKKIIEDSPEIINKEEKRYYCRKSIKR